MRFILMLLSLSLSSLLYASSNDFTTPVGLWKTVDDVNGAQKSIIKISEAQDHTLVGQVIKTFPAAGEEPNKRCKDCTDEKRNQPILGMIILTELKKDNDKWDGGKILDPLNGKYYKCSMQVIDNGKKLKVRGYIGFSLLGRTQTWLRVESS